MTAYDDEPPPTRPSRRIEVFATACQEVVQKLDSLGYPLADVEGRRIRHEAAELFMLFDEWCVEPPDAASRTLAINRVTAMHQAYLAYLIVRAIPE